MASKKEHLNPFKNWKQDLPASIVVFLVAVPLCLGIALASGAPLFAGLISGMIGGLVVGSLSGSSLGVSGPAAGLAVIVLTAIQDLGSFELFLVAVVIAGLIQLALGFLRGGVIAYFFPASVITGMLAGIGVIIFLKQIPHAVGYDEDYLGDLSFNQADKENTFSELLNMWEYLTPSALVIAAVSLAILLLWESSWIKNNKVLQAIPGPLLAVMAGIFLKISFDGTPGWTLKADHLVQIPVSSSLSDFLGNFTFPDWSALQNPDIYVTALVIAIVASLETLLSVEATDKLDPYKRVTPTNRELKAQGIANSFSGLIGGLPITQVIVRSSANIQTGGRTKKSAILHGGWILLSILFIPVVLNHIPLATLAAVLFLVGYKLAKPSLFKKMYHQGKEQFIPFLLTVLGLVFTDLLTGLGIGLAASLIFLLYKNYQNSYRLQEEVKGDHRSFQINLAQEVTFLNKASLRKTLSEIPDNVKVTIDTTQTRYMHHDVVEILKDFKVNARERGIELTLKGLNRQRFNDLPDHITVEADNSSDEVVSTTINPYDKVD